MSPQGALQVYRDLHGSPPPPCTLRAVRGERFELGAPLSASARNHLAKALDWTQTWLVAGL